MTYPYLVWLKAAACLAICGAFFYLGYRVRGDPPESQALVIDSGTIQQNVVKQVVATAKEHKVTVTEKHKDGSTTVTQTVDVAKEKVSDTHASTQVETQHVAVTPQPAPPPPDYSIGLQWRPSLSPDYRPSSVQIGRRLIGDVWVTGEYDFGPHTAQVGVRYEW